jgi:peptide-methionine (R)-S-oxide reductase
MDISDEELRKKLTAEQYHVLRERGTEAPYSGKLLYNTEDGVYRCGVCGTALFSSKDKYESNEPGLAGWPSFTKVMNSDKVELRDDYDIGMHRIEVICKTCGSHLGHLFDDPSAPVTGQHFCINSAALNFTKESDQPKK